MQHLAMCQQKQLVNTFNTSLGNFIPLKILHTLSHCNQKFQCVSFPFYIRDQQKVAQWQEKDTWCIFSLLPPVKIQCYQLNNNPINEMQSWESINLGNSQATRK
ncbi:hypothetical protein AMECASPLE_012018 [Ameca splendens]|uniref:Uncharacterized protein n=1 Tax=Ameca splendens TaxID=208324 RepID=A0ABV0ZBQ2_9TELE